MVPFSRGGSSMTIHQGRSEAVVRREKFIRECLSLHCQCAQSSLPNSAWIDYAEVNGHTVLQYIIDSALEWSAMQSIGPVVGGLGPRRLSLFWTPTIVPIF